MLLLDLVFITPQNFHIGFCIKSDLCPKFFGDESQMQNVFRAYLMNIYDFLFDLFVDNGWVQMSLYYGGVEQLDLIFICVLAIHARRTICKDYVMICLSIRRRSDYIIGFIAPTIGPNKSKKLTRLIAPAHNIRGKV